MKELYQTIMEQIIHIINTLLQKIDTNGKLLIVLHPVCGGSYKIDAHVKTYRTIQQKKWILL